MPHTVDFLVTRQRPVTLTTARTADEI